MHTKCGKVLLVQHKLTNTNMAVGQQCYEKFDFSKKEECKTFLKSICEVCSSKLKEKPHLKQV